MEFSKTQGNQKYRFLQVFWFVLIVILFFWFETRIKINRNAENQNLFQLFSNFQISFLIWRIWTPLKSPDCPLLKKKGLFLKNLTGKNSQNNFHDFTSKKKLSKKFKSKSLFLKRRNLIKKKNPRINQKMKNEDGHFEPQINFDSEFPLAQCSFF